MIMAIKTNIEGGNSFAESLGKFPLYFDELVVNLVEAGEKSGTFESLLDKIATYKEKTEAIKKKVKKALTYPTAVIVVAFIVTGILLYRSEEHTSELQSLMRISYAVFCLKK